MPMAMVTLFSSLVSLNEGLSSHDPSLIVAEKAARPLIEKFPFKTSTNN